VDFVCIGQRWLQRPRISLTGRLQERAIEWGVDN